ncbi:hypothetical protein [Actinocorallia longicatena]|uniref:Uncharacterized protein n=1 Tax=Actinocorallia longicatena TaxID=111803 RepID=A0ABP6QLC0_9ACTN
MLTATDIRNAHEDALDARGTIEANLETAMRETDEDGYMIKELDRLAPARALVRWWWDVRHEVEDIGHTPQCALTAALNNAHRYLTGPAPRRACPFDQGFAYGEHAGTSVFYRDAAALLPAWRPQAPIRPAGFRPGIPARPLTCPDAAAPAAPECDAALHAMTPVRA